MDSTGEVAAGATSGNPLLHGNGANCHIKQGFGDISVRLLLRPEAPSPHPALWEWTIFQPLPP